MKKIISLTLLIFIFSLTGCTSNFDIEIKNETITQNVSISMTAAEKTKETVAKTLEEKVFDVENDTEFLGYFSIVGSNKNNH